MRAVASADGFAEGQRPEGVAADAELEVTAELLDWKTVENVTDDGSIVKKVPLNPALGSCKPRARSPATGGAADAACGNAPARARAWQVMRERAREIGAPLVLQGSCLLYSRLPAALDHSLQFERQTALSLLLIQNALLSRMGHSIILPGA